MEPANISLFRLDALPEDMLRVIVSKVGATSSTDYGNTLLTCKSLNFNLDDPLIAKVLSLGPLVKKPHLADRYRKMMDSLLGANNVDAHYVKGISEYFRFGNHFLGLHHLRLASKGNHKEARYLYGVLSWPWA
ncbi:F-box protein At2g35280-like [Brassica napus]|uniref:F-box protein At2g35280-like n=1 Tax=Brassica napus TaxID=3708 RepID=UPI0020788AEB|nr:F-box protein At2g35280-like [Brassica napus]